MSGLPDEIRKRAPSLAEGRYRVLELVAETPLVHVYRIYDDRIGMLRALQVLAPQFANDVPMREAFVSQAKTLVAFDHPHVLRVVDVQPAGPQPWAVVEDLYDAPLRKHLRAFGPVAPRATVRLVRQALSGLHALHEARFVHSDLHPGRLFVGESGAVKLSEPSLRWVAGTAGLPLAELGPVAPEQRRDPSQTSIAGDLYAVGATLFELSTAEPAPDYLYELEDDALAAVPEPLRPVVRACCQFAPQKRPRSARAVSEGLLRAAARLGPDPEDVPAPLPAGPPDRWPVATAFPGIAAIIDRSGAVRPPPPPSTPPAPHFVDEEEDVDDASTVEASASKPPTPASVGYVMTPRGTPRSRPWESDGRIQIEDLPDYVDVEAAKRLRQEDDEALAERSGIREALMGTPTRSSGASAPVARAASEPSEPSEPSGPAPVEPAAAAPVPPEPTDEQPMVRVAIIGLVAGMGVAFLVVLGGILFVVASSVALNDRAEAAAIARLRVYEAIEAQSLVVRTLSDDLREEERRLKRIQTEPDRLNAALAYIDRVQLTARLVDPSDSRIQRIEDAVRRFRAVRANYESAIDAWQAEAKSFRGRTVLAVGLGERPPKLDP